MCASLCSWWNVNQVKRAERGRGLATLAVSFARERASHTSAAFVEPKRALALMIVFFFAMVCVREQRAYARALSDTGCNCYSRVARSAGVCVCVCMRVDTDTDTDNAVLLPPLLLLLWLSVVAVALPFVYLLSCIAKKLVAVAVSPFSAVLRF